MGRFSQRGIFSPPAAFPVFHRLFALVNEGFSYRGPPSGALDLVNQGPPLYVSIVYCFRKREELIPCLCVSCPFLVTTFVVGQGRLRDEPDRDWSDQPHDQHLGPRCL